MYRKQDSFLISFDVISKQKRMDAVLADLSGTKGAAMAPKKLRLSRVFAQPNPNSDWTDLVIIWQVFLF